MNAIGFLFTLVAGILIFRLPRKWAFVPLLAGAAYMTRGQVLELGPLNFPVVRLLVTIGFLRVLTRGERIAGGLHLMDKLVIAWAVWLVGSSVFHTAGALVFRVGLVWTEVGSYFLFRVFIRDSQDLRRVFRTICVLLIPVAVGMLIEKLSGKNCFASLGGVYEHAAVRNGQFRAQGPFAHAILAGTVGAMCLPMALYLWKTDRRVAVTGLVTTGAIVYSSGSSGPFMMTFAVLFALALWKVRTWMRPILWVGLIAVLALDMVMKDPVYFLMARIDITGGSTGWHRAALIQSAIRHLDEWWFSGTDYTRHWMPTGIHANEIHTDITNHILQMGVWGGLPLVLLFLGIMAAAFSVVTKALRQQRSAPLEEQYLIWTLGAILFAHVTNFFSICYFDQSIVFFYLLLAGIASFRAMRVAVTRPETTSVAAGSRPLPAT